MNIPPLREAEPPRKYRLPSQISPALTTTLAKLEKALTDIDTRRRRFPDVGEEEFHRIRK